MSELVRRPLSWLSSLLHRRSSWWIVKTLSGNSASILTKAQFKPEFRQSLRGGDIYVDEAGLLDNETVLRLLALAKQEKSRVIFQGDTQQLPAVGPWTTVTSVGKEIEAWDACEPNPCVAPATEIRRQKTG
jgi:hypothetical protein